MARRAPVLSVVSGFLLGSIAIRAVLGAEAAQALVEEDNTPVTEVAQCVAGTPPAELVAALQQREEAVQSREEQLLAEVVELEQAKGLLEAKIAELSAAELALKETLALADSAAEKDLLTLTAAYEQMKPADAAALFSEMDPVFAAGFLSRLTPEAAAGVLTELEPNFAYALSAILAGRNTQVPTE